MNLLFFIQRFSEVTDQLGMAILSVTPENPLLWAFHMQNFNLGIVKMTIIPKKSVTSENLCTSFIKYLWLKTCS